MGMLNQFKLSSSFNYIFLTAPGSVSVLFYDKCYCLNALLQSCILVHFSVQPSCHQLIKSPHFRFLLFLFCFVCCFYYFLSQFSCRPGYGKHECVD